MSNTDPSSDKIRFHCTSCGVRLAAPAKHGGATIRCPKCESELPVPVTSEPDPAALRREWSLARCPSCEEVSKVRAENHDRPVVCASCGEAMIVSA